MARHWYTYSLSAQEPIIDAAIYDIVAVPPDLIHHVAVRANSRTGHTAAARCLTIVPPYANWLDYKGQKFDNQRMATPTPVMPNALVKMLSWMLRRSLSTRTNRGRNSCIEVIYLHQAKSGWRVIGIWLDYKGQQFDNQRMATPTPVMQNALRMRPQLRI